MALRHAPDIQGARVELTATRPSFWRRHRVGIIVAAVVVFILYSLALLELGHWMAEGFPPLIPHLREATEHMAGLVGKYLWAAPRAVGKYLWVAF